MYNRILVGIIMLLVIGFGLIYLLNRSLSQPTLKQNKNQTVRTRQLTIPPEKFRLPTPRNEAIVSVTRSGFSPQELKTKRGTKVIWINNSGAPVTVNSNDHPTHLIFPPLNLGQLANGKSVTFIFDSTGTFKYHNHFNPSQTGTVIVE